MLLAIYLNDHLAGATGMLELARRSAASNRENEHGPFLAQLGAEIAEDRESLLEVMRTLGVHRDRAKVFAGWAAEKAGRLKLNGRLLSYSPYSRVLELEVLLLGARGKLALWQALAEIAPSEPRLDARTLRGLARRAEGQLDGLETHRLRAAREAFG
jgi:hypothetical protein